MVGSTPYKSARRVFVDYRMSLKSKAQQQKLAFLILLGALCIFSLSFLALPDAGDEVNGLSQLAVNTSDENHTRQLSTAVRDSCALVEPVPMFHFDAAQYASPEFQNAAEKAKSMPLSARVFTAFFRVYVFDPNTDVVINLTSSDAARAIDIRNARPLMENAIRKFHKDDTVKVAKISFGYSHMCRLRGLRYIFHVSTTSSSKNNEKQETSQHVVAIQRLFDGACHVRIADISNEVLEKPVYFVVPYSNRPNRLRWFLRQFDRLRDRHLNLVLVLAPSVGELDDTYDIVRTMKHSQDVRIVPVKGDSGGYFSRAVAIRVASEVIPDDGLMFISDIDMQIFRPFFENCRMNTIRGHQVYFPVFYTLFAGAKHIDRRRGYWRSSSYGMSCMYKSDFAKVGAYENAEEKFLGWGEEDVYLAKAFTRHKDYEVFRAVEPSLRHKWHVKRCEKYTPSYDACLTMLYDQLGTGSSLGKYLLQKQGIDAQEFLADVADADDSGKAPESVKASGHSSNMESRADSRKRMLMLRTGQQSRRSRRSGTK